MSSKKSAYRRAVNLRSTASIIGLLALTGCVIDKAETSVAVVPANATKSVSEPVDLASERIMKIVGDLHEPAAEHTTQSSFLEMSSTESREDTFLEVFELGDVLFDTDFNTLDGGGANVGNGMRFSRVPRADLKGKMQPDYSLLSSAIVVGFPQESD